MKRSFLLSLLLSLSFCTMAYPINSWDIISETVAGIPSNSHYKIKGVCVWKYRCHHFFYCFDTTLRVDHYLPDYLLMVYPEKGHAPWMPGDSLAGKQYEKALNTTADAIYKVTSSNKMEGGQVQPGGASDSNLRFYEATIIGNPGLFFANMSHLTIGSQASPYTPYYHSPIDGNAWRFAEWDTVTDFPNSLNPFYSVKSSTAEWGALSPRAGFVMQFNSAKAAGVIGLRATALVTGNLTGHLPLQRPNFNNCKACKVSPRAVSDNETQFQLIYPRTSKKAQPMPEATDPSWTESPEENSPYTWIVWRHYEGCIDGPGKLFYKL